MSLMTKTCNGCEEEKSLDNFHNDSRNKDGLCYFCGECKSESEKSFRRTKEGFLRNAYNNQKGRSKKREHAMPDYTLVEFREWALDSPEFHILFDNWVASDYEKMKSPSSDRLDDYKPYTFDNLRWVTWGENDDKHHSDRKNGINNKMSKSVVQITKDGEFVKEYHSARQAARETAARDSKISACCKGKRKTAGGFRWSYSSEAA